MHPPHTLNELRSDPLEWRRRGLTPPELIRAMIEERLAEPGHDQLVVDPTYADFFRG